ncbi:MAG: hypothetical protein SFU99_22795 [Saprospiraceae bacterium]|nr:hypothetical protein [Saprospiraceae bacterium]
MENSQNQGTPGGGMDPKTIGIVAYLTLIGWIVALVLNNPKSEFASFHIRQMLGLILLSVVSWIPFIGIIVAIFALVLWVLGFISAVQGQMKTVPVLGDKFQEWFKSL